MVLFLFQKAYLVSSGKENIYGDGIKFNKKKAGENLRPSLKLPSSNIYWRFWGGRLPDCTLYFTTAFSIVNRYRHFFLSSSL